MTSTETKVPMNGVDIATLLATRNAVRSQPDIAQFQFRARNEWVSGTHNRSTIQGFYGAEWKTPAGSPRSGTTPITRRSWSATATRPTPLNSSCTPLPPA